jgi:hypothetical protein
MKNGLRILNTNRVTSKVTAFEKFFIKVFTYLGSPASVGICILRFFTVGKSGSVLHRPGFPNKTCPGMCYVANRVHRPSAMNLKEEKENKDKISKCIYCHTTFLYLYC